MTSSSGDKCALFESGMYLLREIKYYSICITREGTKLYVLVKSCLKRKMPLERKQTGLQNSDYPNKDYPRPVTCLYPKISVKLPDFGHFWYIFGHGLMTDLNINSRLIPCLNNLTSIISK